MPLEIQTRKNLSREAGRKESKEVTTRVTASNIEGVVYGSSSESWEAFNEASKNPCEVDGDCCPHFTEEESKVQSELWSECVCPLKTHTEILNPMRW